jgi:trimeric autotransporter adhesin
MHAPSPSRLLPIILLVIETLIVQSSRAQIPRILSYQGVLADTAGLPKPDGDYSFTFRMYVSSSGGAPIWSEAKTLHAKRGLFSTILGSITSIPDSVRFDRQYWLGVQVAPDPELSPRMQLASVGSSLNSARADLAQTVPDNSITAGKIAGEQVVKSINNLHDNLTMRGANGASVTTSGDTITVTASGGGGGGIGTVQNTDNALTITNPGGPTTTINLHSPFNVNSNVGIGTTTPNHRLRISGGPAWTSNGWHGELEFDNASAMGWHANAVGNRFGIGQSVGGLYFFSTTSDPGTTGSPANYLMTIADNANVGIGTITPSSKLEIAAQDGLAVTGYNPFLTLRDTNAGNARGVIQGVNGGLNLFANSYLVGSNPTAFVRLDDNGHVGIGLVPVPTSGKLDVNGGGGTGASVGIHGSSNDNYGMYGTSNTSFGVFGESGSSPGVRARTYNPSSYALFTDYSTSSTNFCGLSSGDYALYANGPTVLNGTLSAGFFVIGDAGTFNYVAGSLHVGNDFEASGSKNFRIDHPLDPANKTLMHSCIESNERLLMYSGTVMTDASGDATIDLPSYFEALNINYRYQLTIVGEEFAQAIVSREIRNNQFAIKTDKPSIKVCWQVTGDRNDAYARAHPYVVESQKDPEERGKYYQPELFGQPKEKTIGYRPPPEHQEVSGGKVDH